MSYSVDLWSSYNKSEKRLESNYKCLKDFIKMFSEYYSSLSIYATSLKKIYDIECVSQNESLQIGIDSFKSDILNQIRSLNEFLLSIKDDIINPLIILRENILSKIKKNLEETSKTEKAYHNSVIEIEILKKNFYMSIKEVENYKLKYEIMKKQNMEENNFQDYNVVESNEVKIATALKNAKEKERKYINYIKDINIMQEEYIEIKKKNLDLFQNNEEELGLNLKDSLRKYVIFKISYLRNLQYDLDKKSKLIENINIRKDILDYIFQKSTNAMPPEKWKYSTYKSDIGKNYININVNKDKDIITEVKAYLFNIFNVKNAKEIMDKKDENSIITENLVNKAFSDKSLNFEDKRQISNYSELKRSRRYFLSQLNKTRIKNKLNIGEITFNNLGEILRQNLVGIEKEDNIDFESYKLIIILSTSLYKVEKTNKLRIFLNSFIIDFQIWKKIDFWKKIIQYEIIEEMIKQKRLNLLNLSKENPENKLKRIQLIAKSYLNTYIYHMLSFNVDFNIMNDIISFFSNYYFFEKPTIDFLYNILKNNKKQDISKIEFDDSNNETFETNEIKNDKKTIIIEENNYSQLIQKKQPLDNISKAKQRAIKIEKEKSGDIIYKRYNDNDNLENLNINLINKDNNNFNENEDSKNIKINSSEYVEEDIRSQIALTENSYEKSDNFLTNIKEKSKLKIVNEDEYYK